ncbi:MAG: putative toxin-antitoxin system toxin component, PIN family [Armatimonadota bacterium]|nr:putative toxin-antitoxin system toxin component, PIN family [Armatimonadota bacterium]
MPLQIVIDTNVFVSALRSNRGASFKLLSLVGKSTQFEINLSVPLVLEYEDVANRQLHITGLSAQDVSDIIDYLCSVGNRRQIYFLWRPFLKDPKDDMVLELAVEAQCQYIISFNRRDFAGVEQFGLQVLTPQEFLREIGKHNEHNQSEAS